MRENVNQKPPNMDTFHVVIPVKYFCKKSPIRNVSQNPKYTSVTCALYRYNILFSFSRTEITKSVNKIKTLSSLEKNLNQRSHANGHSCERSSRLALQK